MCFAKVQLIEMLKNPILWKEQQKACVYANIENGRGGGCLTLCLLLGPFSTYWIASSSLDMKICA